MNGKMEFFDDLLKLYSNYDILIFVSICVIFLYILCTFLRDCKLPPGPWGMPIFGYWPFLKTNSCHVHLQELGKEYGDVFSITAFGKLFIHLGSIKVIKEAHLSKSEYFERRYTDFNLLKNLFKEGVPFLNDEPWRVLRRFFLMKFKEYGMNAVKETTSSSLYNALGETVDELNIANGRPVKIMDLVTAKCMMVIRRIIFNDQGVTPEELQEMKDLYTTVMKSMTSTNMLLIGKFTKFCIFPFIPTFKAAELSNKRIEDLLRHIVKKHQSKYDENQVENLIDCYVKERDEKRKKGDPTAVHFTDETLISSLNQFVTDGVLTVGMLIQVILTTVVKYPKEQEKIYEEILEVVGPDRMPTIEDKMKLPYTNAFIYEVMRFTDFFPLFPSLECTRETTLQGYKIPKGSITLLNFYAAHRNDKTYENPEVFNPSRYLSTSNKQRPDLPVLFGVGKRACIGEAFSMIQTFLFLTTIVQKFRLSLPEGIESPDCMFWSDERLEICAHPRSQKVFTKII